MLDDILFYGDPHGSLDQLIAAVEERRPDAVVILGDFDAEAPLPELMKPVTARVGENWVWIPGNHDADQDHWWANSFEAAASHNIHGRVVELAGVQVAGFGGVFRGRIWNPRTGEVPFPTRESLLATTPRNSRFKGGLPRRHHASVFREDFDKLRTQHCDVLVCHEAPSSIGEIGFEVIDQLADAMHAGLVVHGHHHRSYRAELPSGVAVAGLGLAEPVWGCELRPLMRMSSPGLR